MRPTRVNCQSQGALPSRRRATHEPLCALQSRKCKVTTYNDATNELETMLQKGSRELPEAGHGYHNVQTDMQSHGIHPRLLFRLAPSQLTINERPLMDGLR
jgi:hypothetical protein